MICWSEDQVKACRLRDTVKEFEGKHLPWCVFTTPFATSDCNCHNPNRVTYLERYVQSIIDYQAWEQEIRNENKPVRPILNYAK